MIFECYGFEMLIPERTIVSTPVHEYTHPEFENQITLMGMIHIAQESYYRSVQEMIAGHEAGGAIVHYEGVKDVRPSTADIPEAHIEKADRLKAVMSSIYGWFENSGLSLQTEVLEYSEDWENHDSTLIELAGRMSNLSSRRLSRFIGFYDHLFEDMKPEQQQKLVLKFAQAMERGLSKDRQMGWASRLLLGNLKGPILDYRNDIALAALDEASAADPESDFVLVWGAGHLRGLGKGLVKRGYQKVDEDKVQAIDTALL